MKTLYLLILIVISSSSFAFSKKKLISMIQHCGLNYNLDDAGAGSAFVAALEINLKDGSQFHTRENPTKVHFRDFEVEVSGAGHLTRQSKKGIRIRTEADAYSRPYVIVKARLLDRKDIEVSAKIPLHFRMDYKVFRSAYSGADGLSGPNGPNGRCGRNLFHDHVHGEDGEWGLAGAPGAPGLRGNDGGHVSVYVSKVPFDRDNTELVKVEIHKNGKQETRYVDMNKGTVAVFANGGEGGAGGAGGSGGRGGNGGNGSFHACDSDGNTIAHDGFGGHGGNGGHGGFGGPGGDGGNGGQIDVYFKPDTWFFKDRLFLSVNPGYGGRGGYGGQAGQGGRGGNGGEGCGHKGKSGLPGLNGPGGMSGQAGVVNYYEW